MLLYQNVVLSEGSVPHITGCFLSVHKLE